MPRFRITLLIFLLLALPASALDIEAELEKTLGAPPAAAPAEEIATPPETKRPTSLVPSVRVRVTARRHTILSSQSTGRIVELAVRDGDRFEEGRVLARIDPATLELQLLRARAAVRRQQVLYNMVRELHELQTKGEAEVDVAEAELEQARAEMLVIEKLMERTAVAAPFPGRVADVFARENQYVAEGTPLLEILDDSTLELEFIVSSHWVRWFTPGFRFTATVEETGKTYAAVLERVGGKVDPLSQSLKAYATLVDPGPELMEGMSGEAHIAPPPDA